MCDILACVPHMKRTELSPAPKSFRACRPASITSG